MIQAGQPPQQVVLLGGDNVLGRRPSDVRTLVTLAGVETLSNKTFSDTITSTKDGLLFVRAGASAAIQYVSIANTSGQIVWGTNGSVAGGFLTGGAAYGACVGSNTTNPLQFGVNAVMRAEVTTAGFNVPLALTGGTVQAKSAAGFVSSDGSAGTSGSFTSLDAKTITVKDGLITAIV